MPAQEHEAGHGAHTALAGTTEPGKQQLFLAQGSILGLRLTARFVQSTWGFDVRASAGFQVPAMGETSFCPRVNNAGAPFLGSALVPLAEWYICIKPGRTQQNARELVEK